MKFLYLPSIVTALVIFITPHHPLDDPIHPTFEDIIALRNAGQPTISPDGRHIAFTMGTTDWENNRFDTEIWLSRDGEAPFQLTQTNDGNSTNPQWSPDGQWLAFSADRGNKRQVFGLRIAGGEAQPLTNAPEGISDFEWSPDGSQIIYA